MIIELLVGPGCPSCKKLEPAVRKAVEELGLKDYVIVLVEDISKIIEYGVMSPPALVVDGEVRFCGSVPNVADIKKILKP